MPNTPTEQKNNETDASLPLLDNGINRSAAQENKKFILSQFISARKIELALLCIALFATGGIVGMYFQPPGLQMVFNVTGLTPGGGSSHPIAVPVENKTNDENHSNHNAQSAVVALGRLMPLNDIMTIAPPYGAGDARIETILVNEGDSVTTGQVIATLDNRQQLNDTIENAQTKVAVNRAQLAQIESLTQSHYLESKALLNQTQTAYELAKNELARGEELRASGQIAQTELDRLQANADELKSAKAKAQATLSRYVGIDKGTQTDIQLAKRNLENALNELKRAQGNLSMSQVVAAADGQVLSINTRIGERPNTTGVATLGNTNSMQVELEIYQADIHQVAMGQTVLIHAPALGTDALMGTVVRLGLEVKRQKLVNNDPAANTDARIILVRVTLDEASSKRAQNFTGLQVTGRIILDKPND